MKQGRRWVICGGACACLGLAVQGAGAAAVSDPRGRFRLDMVGSFRETMREGARAARISAAALPARGVWAVGPTEDLAGELTILDGTSLVATLEHRRVRVVEDRNARAPFLVWAEVRGWTQRPLPALADQRALEAHLGTIAAAEGLDPDGPFPFLLIGRPTEVAWHVLGGPARPPGNSAGMAGGMGDRTARASHSWPTGP